MPSSRHRLDVMQGQHHQRARHAHLRYHLAAEAPGQCRAAIAVRWVVVDPATYVYVCMLHAGRQD